jgi:glycerate kinase
MLAALGAAPLDATGKPLPFGGAALALCESLGGAPVLKGVTLVAATDVDNPLTGLYGASNAFGPQKGVAQEDIPLLDGALKRFSAVLERELDSCPPGLHALPGGGAAGGIGAALLALGGRQVSGFSLVKAAVDLDSAMDAADVVITGEGSFDAQSLRGKVVSGVAEAAGGRGVPCIVVAGRSTVGRREAAAAGVTEIYSLVEHFGDAQRAMAETTRGLFDLGRRLAQQWGALSR